MAKTHLKLDEENQFDFLLIGIVSQLKDYRICRELNLKLEILLRREDDYDIYSNKRMEPQSFAFFRFMSRDEDEYCLIANKCQKGMLIPEQNQIDYFLIVREGMSRPDETVLLASIKEIPFILGVYKMDVMKLKSKTNLVF